MIIESFLKIEAQECDVMAAKFSFEDQHTIMETSEKLLKGTWLSEG